MVNPLDFTPFALGNSLLELAGVDVDGYVNGAISDAWNAALEAAGLENGVGQAIFGNDDATLSQNSYDFRYRAFPSDLGMDYLGHYMVININVPTAITGSGEARGSELTRNQFTVLPNEYSKVDVLRFGNVDVGDAQKAEAYSFPRKTRRIKESIALYMPGTQLLFNNMNAYEEVSLTAIGGGLGVAAISTAAELVGSALGSSGAGAAVGNLAEATGQVVGTAAKVAGTPISPRVEVLFSTSALRDFQFEFLMVPRNAEEATNIENIVRTLRFHAAPEIDTLFGVVPSYIPPAEFDITFFHNGVENRKIPRINTCVLTRIEVDYAPGTGVFTSYQDGSPVAVRLMLVFKEVEINHKLRILQGF